jgi:hypothetical protein
VLFALSAVLASAGLASASASAAMPEFAGPYPNQFAITDVEGPQVYLEPVKEGKTIAYIKCKAAGGTGEVTGGKTVSATVAFTECKQQYQVPSMSCTTVGAKEGEIRTAGLEGKLVYVNNKQEVGVAFQRKGAGNFAQFTCGSGTEKETLTVRGSVIGTIWPPNTKSKAFRLGFQDTAGVQRPTEYENEKGEKVKAILEAEGTGKEPFAFIQVGLWAGEVTRHATTLNTKEETEVKAEVPASRGLPEFRPSTATFEGSIGTVVFEEESGLWNFVKGTISGKITGPNEVGNVLMTLEGPSRYACTNGKKGEGKVLVTEKLVGRLGYINEGTKEVGLLLEPVAGPVVANCAGELYGEGQEYIRSIIAQITPVNTKTKEFTMSYQQTNHVQIPLHFEFELENHQLQHVYNGIKPGLGMETKIHLTNFKAGGSSVEMKIEA